MVVKGFVRNLNDLMDDEAVLRHKFASRSRGNGIIEHYHDVPNCEFCALLARLKAAEATAKKVDYRQQHYEPTA